MKSLITFTNVSRPQVGKVKSILYQISQLKLVKKWKKLTSEYGYITQIIPINQIVG